MASRVPQENSRSDEMLKDKNEYCQARSWKDFERDDHFSKEYWGNGNEYLGPNEFFHLNHEQPGFRTFSPRFSYDSPRRPCGRIIPPQFHSSCIYYEQQEPSFRDPNFGFREKQLRHHSDGHESRPCDHDCTEKIQNVMLQVRDPMGSQQLRADSGQKFAQQDSEFDQDPNCPKCETQHFLPDDRTHYHGPIYPSSGYSGFANHVAVYDTESLDRFNQESLRSQSAYTFPSCRCHLQNERRIVHCSACVDNRIHGDAYCDTRYFDRSGPYVCCHDCGYLKNLRDYNFHDPIPQNSKSKEPEHPRSKWPMVNVNNHQAGNFALREQCSQIYSNQKLVPEKGDEGANLTAGKRNEFQGIVRHSPTNTSANFDNTRSRQNSYEVDKTEKSTKSKDKYDEKELVNSKDNDSVRNNTVKSRASYFLSLNPPTHARSSFHVNETKMTSVFSKKKQINSPKTTTAAMTSPNESRDSASFQDGFRDDSSLRSSTWWTETEATRFVRGGTRSSLRLPSDGRPVLTEISSRAGKSGGGDDATKNNKTASVDHRGPAGKSATSKDGEEHCMSTSSNTTRNDVFTRLEARRSKPELTRDYATMAKTKKSGRDSTGFVDIYCSVRRPKKTNRPVSGSPYSAQSSCSLLRCSSTNSSSSTTTYPTVKSGYSATDIQSTEGKRDRGVRRSLRRSSSFQEEDKESTDGEGGEVSLDLKSDFKSLERAFNSAISVIASGKMRKISIGPFKNYK